MQIHLYALVRFSAAVASPSQQDKLVYRPEYPLQKAMRPPMCQFTPGLVNFSVVGCCGTQFSDQITRTDMT